MSPPSREDDVAVDVIFPFGLALFRTETKQEVNGGKIRGGGKITTLLLPSTKLLSRQAVCTSVCRRCLAVENSHSLHITCTFSSSYSVWMRLQPMIQLRVSCLGQPARLNTHRYVLPSCLNVHASRSGARSMSLGKKILV